MADSEGENDSTKELPVYATAVLVDQDTSTSSSSVPFVKVDSSVGDKERRSKDLTAEYSPTIAYAPTVRAYFDEKGARAYLTEHHWPAGLQDEFVRGLEQCPMRYFIIDDSGSMHTSDSVRLLAKGPDTVKSVASTRWSELSETVAFHAGLAHAAKARTEFRFLNNGRPFVVGDPADGRSYGQLTSALKQSPNGDTPLCHHIREVVAKISQIAPELAAAGKKAKVIIATDGEASDGNLADAMSPLRRLPVWVVVRLCTSLESVNEYWDGIDRQLELNMDVVQNIVEEAKEVRALNPWLNYSCPLHRIRESGIVLKEADFLDERKLTAEQILRICAFIYGSEFRDAPHPEVDWAGFSASVQAAESRLPRQLNPLTLRKEPSISLSAVKAHLYPSKCSVS